MSAYIVENQSIKPNSNKSSQFKHNSMLPHMQVGCLHSRTKLGQSYFDYCLKKMNDILSSIIFSKRAVELQRSSELLTKISLILPLKGIPTQSDICKENLDYFFIPNMLSDINQTVIRQSSDGPQSSGSHQTVIRQSSDSHQTVTRQSPDSHQTVITHQTVIRQSLI